MKKLITFLIIAYLSFTINSTLAAEDERIIENENTLKVGVLLPLSGKFQDTGKSFLKAIQLALYDISNKNIKIYPKDSKANSLDTYLSAKEFEEEGIKCCKLGICIGKFIYIICIRNFQPYMKKRTRLEIYGISDDTKSRLKEIAKAENVPTGVLVEPVLRRYVREYHGR